MNNKRAAEAKRLLQHLQEVTNDTDNSARSTDTDNMDPECRSDLMGVAGRCGLRHSSDHPGCASQTQDRPTADSGYAGGLAGPHLEAAEFLGHRGDGTPKEGLEGWIADTELEEGEEWLFEQDQTREAEHKGGLRRTTSNHLSFTPASLRHDGMNRKVPMPEMDEVIVDPSAARVQDIDGSCYIIPEYIANAMVQRHWGEVPQPHGDENEDELESMAADTWGTCEYSHTRPSRVPRTASTPSHWGIGLVPDVYDDTDWIPEVYRNAQTEEEILRMEEAIPAGIPGYYITVYPPINGPHSAPRGTTAHEQGLAGTEHTPRVYAVYGYMGDMHRCASVSPGIKGMSHRQMDWEHTTWLQRCAQCGRELPPALYRCNSSGHLRTVCRSCASTNRTADTLYLRGDRWWTDEEREFMHQVTRMYMAQWSRYLCPRGTYAAALIGEDELQQRIATTRYNKWYFKHHNADGTPRTQRRRTTGHRGIALSDKERARLERQTSYVLSLLNEKLDDTSL